MNSIISRNYDEFLTRALKNPKVAAEYLKTALESEDKQIFLMIFLEVAKVRGIVQDDVEDILELLDDELNAQIREGYNAYLRGEARPFDEVFEAQLQKRNEEQKQRNLASLASYVKQELSE